tara:strand:- start:5562 stop:6563 length:1002 start_codon:yes stop_codon:yes gene_type:complete
MYKKTTQSVNYQGITDSIIELMEAGTLPMGSQWETGRNKMLPFNLNSGKMYRGINVIQLWVREMNMGYKSNGWITINQMRAIGKEEGNPVKLITLPDDAPNRSDNKTGQSGIAVFHADSFIPKEWKRQNAGDKGDIFRSEKTGEFNDEKYIRRNYLKVVGTVFNLDQIENLPEKYQKFDSLLPLEDVAPEITAMTNSYGVPINLSPNGSCYYVPSEHEIFLVHQNQFKTPEDFERVKFHELVHSTGHKTLLNRTLTGSDRTKETYAFEELCAELGAAFLCAHYGIPGLMVHANYLEHYLKVLRNDNKAIFKAAAKAQAAVELLTSHIPKKEET